MFCTNLEKMYHFNVPKKKGENSRKMAQIPTLFKLKTGLARDFVFVSSASGGCELKNLALDFLNLLLKKVL